MRSDYNQQHRTIMRVEHFEYNPPEEDGRRIQAQDFQFGSSISDANATISFLTDSSNISCPSSAASSRRSSEVSFAGSSSTFSCFTPTSPISAAPHFDDELAPASNQTAAFRLPFFENEVANLELSESLRPKDMECFGQYMVPSAMSYASLDMNGDTLPHEYSVSGINIYHEHAPEGRTLGAGRMINPKAPMDGGSGRLVPYPNDIDETAMSYLRPSPPFIIPSQMLRNVDSQGEPNTGPSLAGSPEVANKSVISSYYQSENAVGAVEYTPVDTIAHTISSRRTRARYSSRNRSAGAKYLEQSTGSRVPVSELKRATATKSKKYKCNLCVKGFDRQEHYKRHQISDSHRAMVEKLEKKQPGPIKTYSCRKCQRKFNRHDNLKPHIKTHLVTQGKHPRNDAVTVEESWEYGWEEIDDRCGKVRLLPKPAPKRSEPDDSVI